MPACKLYCERCNTQETKSLVESDFGLLLADGVVSIPCASCEEKTSWKLIPPPRREPRVRRDQSPRRVLAIDDDRDTLRILELILRPGEYSVVTAASADEAIEKLQSTDFDVIVSDIRMPEFDGRSLYRFLLVYVPYYAQKVLFLTGDQSEKTTRFLQECGRPWMLKPINLHELESRIREIG
ncbi:MAG: response regulator [Acidobacteria bacterium]|nr:response regulator [Acidobacteriota bacterium]